MEDRAAWVDIGLEAIRSNVRTLKSRCAPGVTFMAVVKADGYGHGAIEAAQATLDAGADRLGVATIPEASLLRDSGFVVPIHVFSEPPLDAAPIAVALEVASTVCSLPYAAALSAAACASGTTARVHLKIDTGMNRIGIRPADAVEFTRTLTALPGIELEGVFTHFATADVPNDWDFEQQLTRFSRALDDLRRDGVNTGTVHAANSAATILHPEAHFDMVRCGIALYGLHPATSTRSAVDLVPAMRVAARVSFVKRVPTGDGVSYGFIYRSPKPVTVATLPLGYADGVHRVLSDRMRVLIGGVLCRQIGRICMDQLMVEVPDSVQVRPGDEAVLVGTQGNATISMDELAEAAGTINYELACSLSLRMDRRYR